MTLQSRIIKSRVMVGLAAAAFFIILIPLFSILLEVVSRGVGVLSWTFLTSLPKPPGEAGGGIGNAIQGSLTIVGLTCLFSIPLSILASIYLSEYQGKLANVIRFLTEVLSGTPSIVAGIFAYSIIVTYRGFSATSGAVALSILMIPTVIITTHDSLREVPQLVREGAIALGISKWRVSISVVLRSAMVGVATGIILGVARVFGETAPLLFTAFGNLYWATGVAGPMDALPLRIYNYAISPYADWQAQAWGAALVLLIIVLLLNVSIRILGRKR